MPTAPEPLTEPPDEPEGDDQDAAVGVDPPDIDDDETDDDSG